MLSTVFWWRKHASVSHASPGDHRLPNGKPSPAILAHVENRLPNPPDDEFEQSAIWVEHFRRRSHDTTFESTRLTSLTKQHNDFEDLLDIVISCRWNADLDLKVRPGNVRDYDGLFRADGVPWETKDEALRCRRAFDVWRREYARVVRVAADWHDFEEWSQTREARRALRSNTRAKTPSARAGDDCRSAVSTD